MLYKEEILLSNTIKAAIITGIFTIIVAVIGLFSYNKVENNFTIKIESKEQEITEIKEMSKTLEGELDSSKKEKQNLESELKTTKDELTTLKEDNNYLKTRLEKYEKIPQKITDTVKLSSLDYFSISDDEIYDFGNTKSNTNETFSNCITISDNYWGGKDGGWVKYYINKNFSTLTGDYFINFDYRSYGQNMNLTFLGNDDKILGSFDMTNETLPTNFSIDVSGQDYLTIQINAGSSRALLLSDLTLFP